MLLGKSFRYQRVEVYRHEHLGSGSYGAVCKAKCDELPCAAKILHPVLFQFKDPGSHAITQKFEQECELLGAVVHPHIVQFLGTCRDPESGMLVLLMELMDESLTHFLERSRDPLRYHVQVNILHDVALALAYLHNNGIIHRDLSSNNVLLSAGCRAKVTDFGMAKLLDVNSHRTRLTQCPGTMVYMAPEALSAVPMYSEKLDTFSHGVLSIQVISRKFPNPSHPKRLVSDPKYPTGKIEISIPEAERRRDDIGQIDPTNKLLSIALTCLKDDAKERLSAKEICQQLALLKGGVEYKASLQQKDGKSHHQMHVQSTQQQVNVLEKAHMHHMEEKVVTAAKQASENLELRKANKQLQSMLGDKEENIHQLQQLIQLKDNTIQQLKEERVQNRVEIESLHERLKAIQEAIFTQGKIRLTMKPHKQAPVKMSRGSAAIDSEGSQVYFRSGVHKVHAYNYDDDEWSDLPDCPQGYFSLAVISGKVTAVGGWESDKPTNTLLSFTTRSKVWKKRYPPMPTKRLLASIASTNAALVVAGGQVQWSGGFVSDVEVMDTDSHQWSTASSLPQPFSQMSATVCGSQIYYLGGRDEGGKTKVALVCSIPDLLKSCYSQSLGGWLSKTLSLRGDVDVWQRICDLPSYLSTCITAKGTLISVGGCDEGLNPKVAIHEYDPFTNTWCVVAILQKGRWNPFAFTLPDNNVMVMGGYTTSSYKSECDTVEIALVD